MDRASLKSISKGQIKGKIWVLLLIAIIIAGVSCAISYILGLIPRIGSTISGLLSAFVLTPAFALSIYNVYLAVANDGDVKASDAFSGFNNFWAAFKVTFMVGLFTFLWSLLFVIPGIIKSISYSMSMYILSENPDKPTMDCINESKEMTEGHKMELFVLGLSFIGWILLGTITLGLGFIYVIPYMNTTFANAYKSLKKADKVDVIEEQAL